MQTMPFHQYRAEIANQMLRARAYPGNEWFDGQMSRIELYYDTGELVDSAAQTMIAFGKGALKKELSPLQCAEKFARVVRF